MIRNKRKHPRLPVAITAEVFDPDSGKKVGSGCIADISLCGIGMFIVGKLELDTPYLFNFTMANGKTFQRIPGKVILGKKDQGLDFYGVKFGCLCFGTKGRLCAAMWAFKLHQFWTNLRFHRLGFG